MIMAEEREVLAGGQAGSGKTDGGIFKALTSVTVEDYIATFFRETEKQLTQAGGIIWQTRKFLKEYLLSGEVVWNEERRELYWPQYNSTITFGYMAGPGDEDNYVGVPRQLFVWGELTRYKFRFDREGDKERWNPYQFLVRSQRKPPGMPVAVQTYADTNPGGASKKFVQGYFLPPPPKGIRKEIEGSASYMVWQPPRPDKHFGGRLYIQGIRRENPGIDHASYDVSEQLADELTQREQFKGEWGVEEEGGVFKVERIRRVYSQPSLGIINTVRPWDKAGTVGGSGPRSASLLMSSLEPGAARAMWGDEFAAVRYVIRHGIAGRWSADQREEYIDVMAGGSAQAALWYPLHGRLMGLPYPVYPLLLDNGRTVIYEGDGRAVTVLHEQEPGSGGKQSAEQTTNRLRGPGYGFTTNPADQPELYKVTGDKEARARSMAASANGGLYVIVDDGSYDVDEVLGDFTRFPHGLIDYVDAGSLGHNFLALGAPPPSSIALLSTRPTAAGQRY
jgi:hypothetical protein